MSDKLSFYTETYEWTLTRPSMTDDAWKQVLDWISWWNKRKPQMELEEISQ